MMQRSITPSNPSPGYGSPVTAQATAYRSGSPFMSGLMGGFLGAGLAGLLFGHGFWAAAWAASVLGSFPDLLARYGWWRFLLRLFRGQSPAFAGGPNIFARGATPGPGMMPAGGGAGRGAQPIQITPPTTKNSSNCCKLTRRPGRRTT